YEFMQEGTYEVEYFVSDEAGNSTTLIIVVIVTEGQQLLTDFDFLGFNNYYESLNSITIDSSIINELANILRTTLTSYRGYDTSTTYNWVYNTSKGGQYILYDTSDFVFDNGNWITTGWTSGGLGYDANGDGAYKPADGDLFVDREHIWPANNMRIKPANGSRTLNQFTEFVLNEGDFDYRPTGSN